MRAFILTVIFLSLNQVHAQSEILPTDVAIDEPSCPIKGISDEEFNDLIQRLRTMDVATLQISRAQLVISCAQPILSKLNAHQFTELCSIDPLISPNLLALYFRLHKKEMTYDDLQILLPITVIPDYYTERFVNDHAKDLSLPQFTNLIPYVGEKFKDVTSDYFSQHPLTDGSHLKITEVLEFLEQWKLAADFDKELFKQVTGGLSLTTMKNITQNLEVEYKNRKSDSENLENTHSLRLEKRAREFLEAAQERTKQLKDKEDAEAKERYAASVRGKFVDLLEKVNHIKNPTASFEDDKKFTSEVFEKLKIFGSYVRGVEVPNPNVIELSPAKPAGGKTEDASDFLK